MTSYHNTTGSLGEQLAEFERQTASQEERVMLIFRKYPYVFQYGSWTPSQLQRVHFADTPLTSVRRALTNLTNEGKLIKTGQQSIGPYGRPEYHWELPDGPQMQLL